MLWTKERMNYAKKRIIPVASSLYRSGSLSVEEFRCHYQIITEASQWKLRSEPQPADNTGASDQQHNSET
jgi:hypothetical protein